MAIARVAALFTLLLVVQLSASANVKGRPVASPAVKTAQQVKAPQVVASDPLPAKVQQETVQKTVEPVQKEKVVEPVPETSADAPQKVNVDATKSVEDVKKAQLDAGHHIQGEGPFVVNAQQLPPDVREEIMRQLNTQYRVSQEKKQKQKQQAVKGQVAQVKSDVVPPSEDESFDPELAAGIAELLTRMAVEDEVGNQYIDLEELPAALKLQVSEYLTKQQMMDEEKEFEQELKLQQQAEKVKAQEANFAGLFNKQTTNSHIDELLSSFLQGALADYSAPASGYYPLRYSPYAYPQRLSYSSGYPLYGVYPQYGGYPSGNRYHGGFRPHSALAAYPYAGLKANYPVSYASRPYVPQSSLMTREQLPQLFGGSVASKLSPFRTIGGPVAGFPLAPSDYVEDLKPEEQLSPLATYYAYYRQLYESEAQPVGSRYAQTSRFHPADFAVQQPRPYVNYKFRRY
ncbi:uncharacterized protein LOC130692796 [Daphnia carinata]|uniref:uncharacterized protein LOC130692796 n=1 Tax=Daphnia carinata TaxID=120202 RepID=UPI0025809DCA|nr:uncharacterized protein LOC130692796 [Daphnia carinata]